MMFAKMLEPKNRTNESTQRSVQKKRTPDSLRSTNATRGVSRRPRTAEDKLIAAINDTPGK